MLQIKREAFLHQQKTECGHDASPRRIAHSHPRIGNPVINPGKKEGSNRQSQYLKEKATQPGRLVHETERGSDGIRGRGHDAPDHQRPQRQNCSIEFQTLPEWARPDGPNVVKRTLYGQQEEKSRSEQH